MSPGALGLGARGRALAAEWRLTAALALALTLLLALTGATQRLDNILYDHVLRATPQAASDQIILVAIDDASLQAVGAWPWPRSVHARLLDQIGEGQPRAIGYDVLFVEPSRRADEDAALAEALARRGNVVLPLMVVVPGPDGRAFDIVEPAGALGRSAAALGQANLHFDADGVVRRTAEFEQAGERTIPQLMIATLAIGEGREGRGPGDTAAEGERLTRSPRRLIPFIGPPGSHRAIPAAAVLAGEVPASFFTDRYVLIGATASGLHDRYATPTSGPAQLTPGIEIHANILQALLEGRAIRGLPAGLLAVLSCAPVIALLLALRRLGPRANLTAGAALIAGWIAASVILLLAFRIWAPPAPAAVGLLVVFPLWAWRRLAATHRYLRDELGRFALEPDVLGPAEVARPAIDVVDRQLGLMEDAVARARDLRRFAADALEGLPDPTFILDAEGRVLFANAAAKAQVGDVEAQRLDDLLSGWARRGVGEDAAAAGPMAGELTSPAGASFEVARAAYESNGATAAAWIVRLIDVTEARAAATQRERLLGFLSHDMRAPQAAILALLDAQSEEVLPPEIAGRIGGYAQRTLDLADNFIHLARAEADALSPEPLDLADLATEAIEALWPLARKSSAAVVLNGAEAAAPVWGDRSLIGRALTNLIENALKHGDTSAPVVCEVRREGRLAIFEVASAGPVISSAQAAAGHGR